MSNWIQPLAWLGSALLCVSPALPVFGVDGFPSSFVDFAGYPQIKRFPGLEHTGFWPPLGGSVECLVLGAAAAVCVMLTLFRRVRWLWLPAVALGLAAPVELLFYVAGIRTALSDIHVEESPWTCLALLGWGAIASAIACLLLSSFLAWRAERSARQTAAKAETAFD